MHCVVYKSPKRDLLYLFVPEADRFDAVSADLLRRFGRPERLMELELTPETRLANASAEEVIGDLQDVGYFLQMPPAAPRL